MCRELWTNENPSFAGKHANFSNVFFQPRPVPKRVPIWVGGESGPAMRRTAKLGDAWYPIGTNPRKRLDTLKRFEGGIDRLRKMARDAGRDPKDVTLAYRFSQFGKSIPEKADNGDRRLGSGDAAAIAADLRALRDLDIIAVDFSFGGDTAETVLAEMRQFQGVICAMRCRHPDWRASQPPYQRHPSSTTDQPRSVKLVRKAAVLGALSDCARYVADWLRGKAPPSPRDGFSAPLILRFAVDDLKAYGLEAAGAGAAKPSSRQLTDWFWNSSLHQPTPIPQVKRPLRDVARNPVTAAGRCRASGRVRPRWDQAFPCYSPLASVPVTAAGRCRASGRVRPRWDQAFPCYSPLASVVGAGPSAGPSGEHPPAGGRVLLGSTVRWYPSPTWGHGHGASGECSPHGERAYDGALAASPRLCLRPKVWMEVRTARSRQACRKLTLLARTAVVSHR